MLRDEPITAETNATGRPTCITRQGRRYQVRVLHEWQAPGEARLYRLQALGEKGERAVAEVTRTGNAFKLTRWWD